MERADGQPGLIPARICSTLISLNESTHYFLLQGQNCLLLCRPLLSSKLCAQYDALLMKQAPAVAAGSLSGEKRASSSACADQSPLHSSLYQRRFAGVEADIHSS